ncbi:hypothetical protein FYK55_18000 [Roseiconus nitratireducens]|uniref:Leucine Rich repeats (2 copies) n=1 Tax=Roseiconus nitratireducens TaxID=2605748 RepID=A0A5M6D1R4_9BACT|nr:hypothetical protein [Roseiconus nitratireducens]KAA5541457.1 hypothetical protein FYK55_18000 [Roseiconus nitratireducens]
MQRLRFSTRVLLLSVAVAAIGLMVARGRINRYQQIGRDVERLDRLGFVVDLETPSDHFLSRYAPEFKGYPTYIRLYNDALSTSETDELLAIIGRNPSIEKLVVHVRISEKDAARLLALPMQSLGISETPIGDTLNTSASPTLEWLSFHRTRLNDHSLQSLGPMPAVQYLDLTRTRVSDDSIDYLAALPRLKNVVLRRCKVTAEGAEELRRLRPGIKVRWEPLSRSQ